MSECITSVHALLLVKIEARRAELQRMFEERQSQYAALELELKERDRELCGILGGMAELTRVQGIIEADQLGAELGMTR